MALLLKWVVCWLNNINVVLWSSDGHRGLKKCHTLRSMMGYHLKRQIFKDLAQELNGTEQVRKEVLAKRRNLIMRQRAIWDTRRRIEAEGGVFRYYSADTTQKEALAQAIEMIHKDFGPIHGVIHGAGIIEPLRDKTVESFRRVVTKALFLCLSSLPFFER